MAGVATNVGNDIIGVVVQKMRDVIKLEKNLQLLATDFRSLHGFLTHVGNQFQPGQKRLPVPVERRLERMRDALEEAKRLIHPNDLIDPAKQQPEWCLPCRRHPDLSKFRVWKARFDVLMQDLEMALSISSNTEQIVSLPAPWAQPLLQSVPDPGFVGSGIQSAQKQLQEWLAEPRSEAGVIGVYGAGGVGKTSLLKIVYNTYKKEVSGFFDALIWFTVSRSFEIEQLQASISEALNLSLDGTSTETRKMKLYASLERKRFLLILDNVLSPIELNEVGVKIGDDNGSKLLISSRSREVIDKMVAKDYFLMIEPLSSQEGWDLFRRGAFTSGVVPENTEPIAREIASQCKGLPLAINIVAAAMSSKKNQAEWKSALNSMRNTDPSFQIRETTIDEELDRPLRWSYNDLSDSHLQNCFLNCAAFLGDNEIVVETLVEMWDAEGLLNREETPYLMDAGRHCIKKLVSRCLVECVEYIVDDDYHSAEYLKIHELLLDMAIDIGSHQREEECLFVAGQQLQNFPSERDTRDCKRISVAHTAIKDLPTDLQCPKLENLVLASNIRLEEVPKGFFSHILSLKVLDLSSTSIKTLPTSVEQLKKLKFLNLSNCFKLVDLPESLCNLPSLQILNLNSCLALHSLPTDIGELKNLKHLKLDACYSLMELPQNLSQLTSLNTLILPRMESICAMSVEDLSKLSELMELTTVVKSRSKVDTMNTWFEMRNLTLEYDNDADAERDHVAPEHVILQNMVNMNKLQNFHLINYQGVTLPNSICNFQNMKTLFLRSCYQLKVLFTFDQSRSESSGNSFPVLEKLVIRNLLKLENIAGPSSMWNEAGQSENIAGPSNMWNEARQLENIAGPSSMWNEGTMSNLQLLVIMNCPLLKKLPSGMKLPHLKELHITMCNELMALDIENDGFPMLEMLTLDELNKLERIAGTYIVWNESTMSKLRILEFIDCPLLKRLPTGMEKLSSLRQINGELDWWQRITWQDDKMRTSLSRWFVIV